jgi:hypothetical protein
LFCGLKNYQPILVCQFFGALLPYFGRRRQMTVLQKEARAVRKQFVSLK